MILPLDNAIGRLYSEEYFSPWPINLTKIPEDVDARKFSVLPLGFDSNFSHQDYADWSLYFRETWWVPFVVALLYCELVFVGQKFMKDRKPFDLKNLLGLWNFILAVYSIVGAIQIVPYFVYTLVTSGPAYFLTRIATMTYGQGGPVSFWCLTFAFSKYAELLDTAFLVLRKKPVSLLHWYHHATVLVVSLQTFAVNGPTGIIMCGMNIVVHSVMYTYYFLAAVLDRPPSWGRLVTKMQIAQMVAGTVMAVSIFVVPLFVDNSFGVTANNVTIGVIYVSYLVLFVQFYSKRYAKKRTD
jgi:hypothetical protein